MQESRSTDAVCRHCRHDGPDQRMAVLWVMAFLFGVDTSTAEAPRRAALLVAPADWGYEEKAEFLRTASVVSTEDVGHGVTDSRAIQLSDGRFTHRAHFQTINVFRREAKVGRRAVRNFEDHYRFNIGASRLDRLMGLDLVPVSVERIVGRERGAVTWWVDDVEMTEMERISNAVNPPHPASWNDQVYRSRVFTQLIQDSDPNQGNTVITDDWRLWLVDFTRAFRQFGTLTELPTLKRIDRAFYASMVELDEDDVFAATRPYLSRPEVKALIKRRGRLVQFFEQEIERYGEAAVFIERPPPRR